MECLCDMTYGFRWFETVSARLSESPGYNSQEYRIDVCRRKIFLCFEIPWTSADLEYLTIDQ